MQTSCQWGWHGLHQQAGSLAGGRSSSEALQSIWMLPQGMFSSALLLLELKSLLQPWMHGRITPERRQTVFLQPQQEPIARMGLGGCADVRPSQEEHGGSHPAALHPHCPFTDPNPPTSQDLKQ